MAAARRAGERGDGFFPGGWLPPAQRAAHLEHMRTCAIAAGRRDPDRLEVTRWASLELDPAGAESLAEQGAGRLVVPLTAADDDGRSRQLEEFAERHALG